MAMTTKTGATPVGPEMRTASPWWASLVFAIGLLFLFVGQRALSSNDGARLVMSTFGAILVIATTGARVWTTLASRGGRRRVERTLLLCYLGALVALGLYALGTKWGMGKLGMDTTAEDGHPHFKIAILVVWSIVMLVSMVPMAMIEFSLGSARRTAFEIDRGEGGDGGVEYFRVRELGWSGITIALGAALMMTTCGVGNLRNVRRDVSYFKTSAPGDSTKAIVKSAPETLHVYLFFPPVNQVTDEVRDYFESLASGAGNVKIEQVNRYQQPDVAAKFNVTKDGVIIIARGEGDPPKNEKIEIDTDFDKARKGQSKLRNLDREVNTALMKVIREKRTLYLVTGHGEINDPSSMDPYLASRMVPRDASALRTMIDKLNYQAKNLAAADLMRGVPDDATIVMLLAPTKPLLPAELDALGAYLEKGGRLFLVLDPVGKPSLGSLEGKLGVAFDWAPLTDDKRFYPFPKLGAAAQRVVQVTDFTSSHPAASTQAKAAGEPFMVINAGSLRDVPFDPTANAGAAPKKTVIARTADSTWADVVSNFRLDDQPIPPGPDGTGGSAGEKRAKYSIGVAVEYGKLKNADGTDKDGGRALVYADGDLFIKDPLPEMLQGLIGTRLFVDGTRWLGGEEVFTGELESEDDKPIQHTKGQDAVWFYLTIIGGPLLVLSGGLAGTLTRRRKKPKQTPKTPEVTS